VRIIGVVIKKLIKKMDDREQREYFQKIIQENKGILYKVANAYCRNEDDRQDLIQEMMIGIWKSINRYDGQFKMSTWIYRISLNVAISFYRKQSARANVYTVLNEQTAQIAIEDLGDDEVKLKLLEQFISELREIDKALMILYLEDKGHAEIAAILGMSVSNVGTKITRIRGKLKTQFSKLKS